MDGITYLNLGYGKGNRSLIMGQHLGYLQLGYFSGLLNSGINFNRPGTLLQHFIILIR
jgi:hypothetical protein